MMRGNHDDPAYFATDSAGHTAIEHMRWRTVPDYAVIEACGRTVLCVGGAVSVDRQIRLQEMSRHPGKVYYWPDEAPAFRPDELESIPEGLMIDTIVTHTAPSFCELNTHVGLESWAEWDPALLEDVAVERATMDLIYECIKRHGHPIRKWYYGHFHQSWNGLFDGTQFSMLDIMEFKEVRG